MGLGKTPRDVFDDSFRAMAGALNRYKDAKRCGDRLMYLFVASGAATRALDISIAHFGNPRVENQIKQRMNEVVKDFGEHCVRAMPIVKFEPLPQTRSRHRYFRPERSVRR